MASRISPLLVAAVVCGANAAPDIVQTFMGIDGTCSSPATTASRFYAATVDAAAPAWRVSDPAPLAFERGFLCTWYQRPAVDRSLGRTWHVSGLCTNGTRIAVEWALGTVAGAPPTYTGACSFDAPFSSPGWGAAALPLLAFDRTTFAGGPIIINATAATPTDGPAVVGLVVPPDPDGRVQTFADLPACGASALSRLPLGTDVTTDGVLAAETHASAPSAIVHVHRTATAYANVTGLSPTTGALLWAVNASIPVSPPGRSFFGGWQSAELHRGVLYATGVVSDARSTYHNMYRGAGLAAGGAVALPQLPVQAPYAPETFAVEEFGPYETWIAAPAGGDGDWPVDVALMNTWLDPYSTNPYARTSHCRPLLQYAFTNATLRFVTLANGTARTQKDWTISFCPLPRTAACEHPGLARGWLPDA